MTPLRRTIDGHTVVVLFNANGTDAGQWEWKLYAPNHAWLRAGTALTPGECWVDAQRAIHSEEVAA